jgi:uncharacterized RDD family membrane protein YckC
MKYAGFGRRFWAMIFDLAVMNIAIMAVGGIALSVSGYAIDPVEMEEMQTAFNTGYAPDAFVLEKLMMSALVYAVVSLIVVVVVDAIMPATKYMASPGKLVLGMVVTDEEGNRISYGRAFGRHAGKALSGLTLGIGFLMAAFGETKQALHDKMAGTVVVRKRYL